MNYPQFAALVSSVLKDGKILLQRTPEWRAFLEYAHGCFAVRGVSRPVVLEIGVADNTQRRFYETCLNAEYIGLDIDEKSRSEIVGDSHAPETVAKVRARLAGRPIDLLFIDGDHSYASVKADCLIYGSMTRHIVAIHDIYTAKANPTDPVEVYRFWDEVLATNKTDTLMAIQHQSLKYSGPLDGRRLGIGVIVKSGVGG